MNPNPQPIETTYRGYRFRSRLEARWAVFFDHLGIKWEYEAEGYNLPSGYYLPDFWLPSFNGGMFAEIKAGRFTPNEGHKCNDLVRLTGKAVLQCEGSPDFKFYWYVSPWKNDDGQDDLFSYLGAINCFGAIGENRMEEYAGTGALDSENFPMMHVGSHHRTGEAYIKAIHASRSARFEYNDPTTKIL